MNPKHYVITRKCAIALAIYCALILSVAVYADDKPATVKPDPVIELTKERDDLKAKVTASEQQAAGLQAQNQYLSVLAERNEMAVRLLQATARVEDLQKQLEAEKVKVSGLEAEKAKWDEAMKKSVEAGLLKK